MFTVKTVKNDKGVACNNEIYIRRCANWSPPTPYMAFINNTIEKHQIIVNGGGNTIQSYYPDTDLRSNIFAYNIPKLIEHYNTTKQNMVKSQKDIWQWVFILNGRIGTTDVGSVQIYGDSVITGSNAGVLYILDVNTGNQLKTLENYEGMSCGPVMVNGIMYSYGGNNKWNTSINTKYASFIMMSTPYGK